MSSSSAKDETTEYNKKLKAYVFIAITSLISVASVSEANAMVKSTHFSGRIGVNLIWGIFTFILSVLIIIADVVDIIRNKIDIKTMMEGKLEGYTLLGESHLCSTIFLSENDVFVANSLIHPRLYLTVLVTCWIVGLISLTRAGSIGYSALNVYFSTWVTFFGCIHAFNLWLGEMDYVTINQMCSLSATVGQVTQCIDRIIASLTTHKHFVPVAVLVDFVLLFGGNIWISCRC